LNSSPLTLPLWVLHTPSLIVPHSFSQLERAVIASVDEVINPLSPEFFSVDGIEIFTNELEKIEKANRVTIKGKRISFYKSKLIVEQIGKSQQYGVIQKVICIIITNYRLFDEAEEYINHFRFYYKDNGLCFEAIPEEIYTVELPKLPQESDGSRGWNWTRFLQAQGEEELEMVAKTNGEIRKAVDQLYELSADEQVRAEYNRRQKAVLDYNSRLADSFQSGETKKAIAIAQNLIREGWTSEKIAETTGLDLSTVQSLYGTAQA
jgi:predicted transposase/invertase (TIGR01784 family)